MLRHIVWQCYLSSDLFNGERVFGWSRSAAHTVDCDDFKSVFDTGENILKKHKFNICFTKTFWTIQIENFLTRDCIFHWFEWENIWVTAIGSRPFENSDWITTTIGFSCEVDWTCWEGKWRFTLKKVLFLVLEYLIMINRDDLLYQEHGQHLRSSLVPSNHKVWFRSIHWQQHCMVFPWYLQFWWMGNTYCWGGLVGYVHHQLEFLD